MYPDAWLGNAKLKRCTHAEKGMWIDLMCLMHDGESYGILRWPMEEIARSIGAPLEGIQSLVTRRIFKGADTGQVCEPLIYVPRHGRKNGKPVTLIPEQPGPIWYSSRMVTDEYIRIVLEKNLRKPRKPDSPLAPKGVAPLHSPLAPKGVTPLHSPLAPNGVHPCIHLSEVEDKDEDKDEEVGEASRGVRAVKKVTGRGLGK